MKKLLFIFLSVLIYALLIPNVHANCSGCNRSWEVELLLKDGGRVKGYISLRENFFVAMQSKYKTYSRLKKDRYIYARKLFGPNSKGKIVVYLKRPIPLTHIRGIDVNKIRRDGYYVFPEYFVDRNSKIEILIEKVRAFSENSFQGWSGLLQLGQPLYIDSSLFNKIRDKAPSSIHQIYESIDNVLFLVSYAGHSVKDLEEIFRSKKAFNRKYLDDNKIVFIEFFGELATTLYPY